MLLKVHFVLKDSDHALCGEFERLPHGRRFRFLFVCKTSRRSGNSFVPTAPQQGMISPLCQLSYGVCECVCVCVCLRARACARARVFVRVCVCVYARALSKNRSGLIICGHVTNAQEIPPPQPPPKKQKTKQQQQNKQTQKNKTKQQQPTTNKANN